MEILIRSLVLSWCAVNGYFLYDAYKKQKKTFFIYAYQFLVLSIIFYLINVFILPKKLEAADFRHHQSIGCFNYEPNEVFYHDTKAEIEILRREFYNNQPVVTREKKAEYHKKMAEHWEQGKKAYNRAQDLAMWYLPTLDEEQSAEYCWDAAHLTLGAVVFKATPVSACLGVILQASLTYTKHCSKQWQEMQYHLHDSEHHFELAEWHCSYAYGDVDVKPRIRKYNLS